MHLPFNPIAPLLASSNPALKYFVERNLLERTVPPVSTLWNLSEVKKIIQRQTVDGSWKSHTSLQEKYPSISYPLIETWKQLRYLVDMYGLTREHPALERAAEFVLSCQTEKGDIRGFLGNQYMPYYHGALLGLLITAGYAEDARVVRGMQWLLEVRQDDGGWVVPLMTEVSWNEAAQLSGGKGNPVPRDPAKPFSHNCTGMVLRAFAAHPVYRRQEVAKKAAVLMKARFFQKEPYTSYQSPEYWVKFQFPFWWNNLVAALDSISLIEAQERDGRVEAALDWLRQHQQPDGLWRLSYAKKQPPESTRNEMERRWVSLAICRILKRYSEG